LRRGGSNGERKREQQGNKTSGRHECRPRGWRREKGYHHDIV